MRRVCLHDKATIEAYLRRDALLQVYSLGDLDDDFWPHTTWYGLEDEGQVRAVALLYSGLTVPTLLATGTEEMPLLEELLCSIRPILPRRFYAHLSPGLDDVLRCDYQPDSHGLHYKMGLTEPRRLAEDTAEPSPLRPADQEEVLRFYQASYPSNSFEPQMLAIGQYYGLRRDGKLVSVAGVHVYSPTYRVAALGNIATRPDCRGKGFARLLVSHLCRQLLRTVDHIGLNVKTTNAPAIACYEAMGFSVVSQYEECMLNLA